MTLEDRIKEAKSRLDPYSVVAKYGNQVTMPGQNIRCPNQSHPQTGATPPCSMNYQTGLWHCFGCNAGGDLLDFIGYSLFIDWNPDHRGKRLIELLDMLAGLQIAPVKHPPQVATKQAIKLTFDQTTLAKWTANLMVYPELIAWLNQRGVHDIERWKLGYHNKRLMIPWFYRGVCVAVKMRTNPFSPMEPKYISLTGSSFAAPYNVDLILEAQEQVYIVETELDAMLITESLKKPCVACPAGNIKRVIPYLAYAKEVILIRDNDKAGEAMAAALKAGCKRAKVIAPPLEFIKDVGAYQAEFGALWEI